MAREALARAYAAGAAQSAGEDFRIADQALRDAEKQFAEGHDEAARDLLPFAARWAHRAQVLARLAKEDQQRAEEERSRPALSSSSSSSPPQPPVTDQIEKPKTASLPKPPALPVLAKSHAVSNGETLWTIAAEQSVYGDSLLWPLLYKANRDQIKDPRHVYPGQLLRIPREVPASEVEEARQKAQTSDIFPVRQRQPSLPPPSQ